MANKSIKNSYEVLSLFFPNCNYTQTKAEKQKKIKNKSCLVILFSCCCCHMESGSNSKKAFFNKRYTALLYPC